jgi:hypothetical protein
MVGRRKGDAEGGWRVQGKARARGAQVSPMDIAQAPRRSMAAGIIVSDAKNTSMSMIGFATRSGTAVLPTCSMAEAMSPERSANCFAKGLKESGPVRVVVQNDDGIRHGSSKYIEADFSLKLNCVET